MTNAIPQELIADLQLKWDSFQKAAEAAGIELPADTSFLSDLKKVFAFSDFVAKNLTRHPELLMDLIKKNDLNRSYSDTVYQQKVEKAIGETPDEELLGSILRKFRCREMIRIAFRDLSGRADLLETMENLSALADTCIEQSFAILTKWQTEKHGTPEGTNGSQQIVVIGLGKLGARELNFSSDVDLIFAFPETGKTLGGSETIENEEYFTRLARSFLKLFGQVQEEGILFRVDLRLRPFGENGPLVMSFNALEDYYQAQGREWERYALIKARVVAGDKETGRDLLKRLNPFVYRRYFDYGTFESLRNMKQSITFEVARKGLLDNIKIGPGGIREIEFFGQVFQLLRGGVEPILQESAILNVLNILVQRNYIQQAVCDELTNAYVFLRNTEHRLQEYADQQVHTLPSDPIARLRLAVSLDFETEDAFISQLETHRKNVHYHFTQLLVAEADNDSENKHEKELQGIWTELIKGKDAERVLLDAGFENQREILGLLDILRTDPATRSLSSEGRKRLNKLIPMVIQKTGQSDQPVVAFKRIVDLIKAIEQRTCYIALFLENPNALEHLVDLSNISPWIISFLSNHPVLLDELLDARTLYRPPSRKELMCDLKRRFESIYEDDLEVYIEELCIFRQVSTLRVAAADVSASYPLMRVSDHLSDIAELVLEKVFYLCFEHLSIKHGKPDCSLESGIGDKGFAVVAFGKLGGIELGYGSDLDLVFLHAASPGQTNGGTGHPIDNSQFYTRLGQRIVHILTTHTRAGNLYEIDMRLRPSGSSGPLVSHIESYGDYQAKDAWTWEHQALVRARAITGDPGIIKRFNQIRKDILCRFREKDKLQEEIRSMRDRMRKSHKMPKAGMFGIKQSRGGIVDIEFLVQYLILLNAHKYTELVEFSDNIRQLETLSQTGIMDQKTAQFLKDAYLTFRAKVHRLNLQQRPIIVPEKDFQKLRNVVKDIWKHYLEGDTY